VAWSLPLGAARLTRDFLADGRGDKAVHKLRRHIRTTVAHDAGLLRRSGTPDHAVATSKTFRSLARICGAAPSSDGDFVSRTLDGAALDEWIPKLLAMDNDEIGDLPGVSSSRAHQIVAGALVADAVLDIFDVEQLEICPWAMREGVILERLDQISFLGR
jgi:exopolyphosphatase/guanosine-5'-triphosphate,3'-diphosphate pyrophosphatase